jgi:hypothetical protein
VTKNRHRKTSATLKQDDNQPRRKDCRRKEGFGDFLVHQLVQNASDARSSGCDSCSRERRRNMGRRGEEGRIEKKENEKKRGKGEKYQNAFTMDMPKTFE